MNRSTRAMVLLIGVAVLAGCGRDQETSTSARTPIVETRLRTPKGTTRVGQALSSHTPKQAVAEDEPIVRESTPKGKTVVTPTAEAAKEPTAKAEPTAETKAAPPAAEPTPMRAIARKAIVARGVELAEAPRGSVLGEFQGRTEVDVIEERDGWARVRTLVIDGGSIEGWVEASRLADPSKASGPKAPPVAKGAPPVKAGGEKTASAAAGSAPAKAAPAKAAGKKPAGNGPDNVTLVPIAGTEKKRPATPFTHKAHWEDYSIKCETCHHPVKAQGGAVPSYSCSSSGCHTATECNNATVGKKNKACPNFEDAYHMQCIDCHKKDGGPTKCAECHTG